MDTYKSWSELEMAKFDSLSPEMRELVRKYNVMPMRGETLEHYLKDMKAMFPAGVI